jgi:hypothetical protein
MKYRDRDGMKKIDPIVERVVTAVRKRSLWHAA